jgi:chemotaxis protein MotB
MNSCISTKVFNDLESRYIILKKERIEFLKSGDSLQQAFDMLNSKWQDINRYLSLSRDSIRSGLFEIKSLENSYVLLKDNSESIIQDRIAVNNSLLKKIALKETELQYRSERVDQLERMINKQKMALNELKESLSDALLNFKGKGLTVEQLNGKVYVSMENKLLFKSGSWDIEENGKKALIQLSKVLEVNPEISILIEGHTDNVPFSRKGELESNWDLSTKRATAVVNIILQNDLILPQNLTAAGRSEYLPIAPNSSLEGRASNRRIEVILSPSFDEIASLLQTN